MNKCRVCRKFGHAAARHEQKCIICGGDPTIVAQLKDVDVAYRCKNRARHEEIRVGFGAAPLVGLASPVVAKRKKADKNQTRLFE